MMKVNILLNSKTVLPRGPRLLTKRPVAHVPHLGMKNLRQIIHARVQDSCLTDVNTTERIKRAKPQLRSPMVLVLIFLIFLINFQTPYNQTPTKTPLVFQTERSLFSSSRPESQKRPYFDGRPETPSSSRKLFNVPQEDIPKIFVESSSPPPPIVKTEKKVEFSTAKPEQINEPVSRAKSSDSMKNPILANAKAGGLSNTKIEQMIEPPSRLKSSDPLKNQKTGGFSFDFENNPQPPKKNSTPVQQTVSGLPNFSDSSILGSSFLNQKNQPKAEFKLPAQLDFQISDSKNETKAPAPKLEFKLSEPKTSTLR